ncbi:MAG: hypothetical protein LBG19_09285 [Prevotellaceae bacterium]|nr:hypothetical protein [Prevotellaceae bacterium]
MQCANEYFMRCKNKQFEMYDRQLLNGLFLYFIGSPLKPLRFTQRLMDRWCW